MITRLDLPNRTGGVEGGFSHVTWKKAIPALMYAIAVLIGSSTDIAPESIPNKPPLLGFGAGAGIPVT